MPEKSSWPDDWPEEKKTGFGFLQELMRRWPDRVTVGTMDEAQDWLNKEEKKADE